MMGKVSPNDTQMEALPLTTSPPFFFFYLIRLQDSTSVVMSENVDRFVFHIRVLQATPAPTQDTLGRFHKRKKKFSTFDFHIRVSHATPVLAQEHLGEFP